MFFYVDESGHTGAHLFDKNQPNFYYGVLSSKLNLDILAEDFILEARKRLGVARLHANEIGIGGLVNISDLLLKIQKKYRAVFDFYVVKKIDHAIICFFDQVFDQGNNPAVPWTTYWTPLRYLMIFKLAHLFCEDAAKEAWQARIEINRVKANEMLISTCQTILNRVTDLQDERSREIISDALNWVIKHPDEICYNCSSTEDVKSITPNIIGFQSALFGIKNRVDNIKSVKVIVDQQSEFNKAQKAIARIYEKYPKDKLFGLGCGLPQEDLKNIPTSSQMKFSSSRDSCGLELVDLYMWIFKRFILENKEEIPCELYPLIDFQIKYGQYDEISIKGLEKRWGHLFINPPEVSEEQLKKAKELLDFDEARRKKAIMGDY